MTPFKKEVYCSRSETGIEEKLYLQCLVHDLADLLCVGFGEASPHDGEVLAEDENGSPVDLASPGHLQRRETRAEMCVRYGCTKKADSKLYACLCYFVVDEPLCITDGCVYSDNR